MADITLRKENVVKVVESEDAAKALERKGFVRGDASLAEISGTADAATLEKEVARLKKQLEKASEAAAAAGDQRAKAEKELQETKDLLEDANKEIAVLTQELQGTREQLEAAVKKAAAPAKK